MQGCLKSSLVALRAGSIAEPGPFFVAFFNYSVGLERLLKVLLIVDHYSQNAGQFPSNDVLRRFGHDLESLQDAVVSLFPRYAVRVGAKCVLDEIDQEFLELLSSFAKQSRYFNLDTLTGSAKSADPLLRWNDLVKRVYENDVPDWKRLKNEEQLSGLVETNKAQVVFILAAGLDGKHLPYGEFCQDYEKMRLALPEVVWRLVRALVPLKELMRAIRKHLHEEDRKTSDEPSIPFMEEFLDFVCEDRVAILEDADWPYFS